MSLATIHYSAVAFLVVLLLAGGYFVYENQTLQQEKAVLQASVASLESELSSTKIEYASTTQALGVAIETLRSDLLESEIDTETANKKFEDTVSVLQSTQQNLIQTEQNLNEEKQKVGQISEVVQGITQTVNTLEKLSQTDKELLQKYSRVYFLNEHYRPDRLALLDSQYTFSNKEVWLHAEVVPRVTALLEAAIADGTLMFVVSGFRSFDQQGEIKVAHQAVFGEGANQFSADQGYSEHQLGTTVDFTSSSVGGELRGFENTNAYVWLLSHAHEYGFILSYPPGNAFYIFEPWHWRYVGVDLATKLYNDDTYFYDVDQRVINNYLIEIFN